MTWRLTISWWEGGTKAKAKAETKAKLKVEAKVKDNDLATDNSLVGGWVEPIALAHHCSYQKSSSLATSSNTDPKDL